MARDDDPLPERLRQAVAEAAREEADHRARERNAGIAIAVLAVLVILLFISIVSGATDAYQP